LKKQFLFARITNNGNSESVKADIIKTANGLVGQTPTNKNSIELSTGEGRHRDIAAHSSQLPNAHCAEVGASVPGDWMPAKSELPEGTLASWVYSGPDTVYTVYVPVPEA